MVGVYVEGEVIGGRVEIDFLDDGGSEEVKEKEEEGGGDIGKEERVREKELYVFLQVSVQNLAGRTREKSWRTTMRRDLTSFALSSTSELGSSSSEGSFPESEESESDFVFESKDDSDVEF